MPEAKPTRRTARVRMTRNVETSSLKLEVGREYDVSPEHADQLRRKNWATGVKASTSPTRGRPGKTGNSKKKADEPGGDASGQGDPPAGESQ